MVAACSHLSRLLARLQILFELLEPSAIGANPPRDGNPVDNAPTARFFAHVSQSAVHHLARFSKTAKVPHAPLTANENPLGPTRAKLFALAVQFLCTGQGYDGVIL